MSKINIINCCGDCSYRFFIGHKLMCDLVEGREANESGPIPKWCPLKDTPDKDYPDHPCKFAGTCDYILMICDECTEKETR